MRKRRDLKNGGSDYIDQVQPVGNLDYVVNGKVITNSGSKSVLVETENDLALLGSYEAGTIAYTAGFVKAWQKNSSGQWIQMVGGE